MSTRIREFRKLRGLTLQTLAQKVGTTAQTIQRLETGNMTVSLDWLTRIANAFGVPPAALIVSEMTTSVQVIGTVGADGAVTPHPDGQPEDTVSVVIAAPRPVAVRTESELATFAAGTVLVGDRADYDPEMLIERRDCLVGFTNGEMACMTVTNINGSAMVKKPNSDAEVAVMRADIDWIAPIQIAIRYL